MRAAGADGDGIAAEAAAVAAATAATKLLITIVSAVYPPRDQ